MTYLRGTLVQTRSSSRESNQLSFQILSAVASSVRQDGEDDHQIFTTGANREIILTVGEGIINNPLYTVFSRVVQDMTQFFMASGSVGEQDSPDGVLNVLPCALMTRQKAR